MSDRARKPRVYAPHVESPHVDTQNLTDKGTDIYETVATLEYAGRRPSRSAIAAATRLGPAELDEILADLTSQGLLVAVAGPTAAEPGEGAGDTVYEPARRDWSTRPDQAQGHSFG